VGKIPRYTEHIYMGYMCYFFIAAWQKTIHNFNLVMHSNVCKYLWGCNLSDFLRPIVDNDEGHNISNTCKHADC